MIGLLYERYPPSVRAGNSCNSGYALMPIRRSVRELLYTVIEGLES